MKEQTLRTREQAYATASQMSAVIAAWGPHALYTQPPPGFQSRTILTIFIKNHYVQRTITWLDQIIPGHNIFQHESQCFFNHVLKGRK